MHAHQVQFPSEARGVRYPGIRVIGGGGHQLPDVGAKS